MTRRSSHVDLAMYAIKVFANDGTIDENELSTLLAIALEDGEVDDDERETLANIFDRVPSYQLSPAVRDRIAKVRERFRLDDLPRRRRVPKR